MYLSLVKLLANHPSEPVELGVSYDSTNRERLFDGEKVDGVSLVFMIDKGGGGILLSQKNLPPDLVDVSYTLLRVCNVSSIVGRFEIDSDQPRRNSLRMATGQALGTDGRSPNIDTLSFT
jgi:hypothetical protein